MVGSNIHDYMASYLTYFHDYAAGFLEHKTIVLESRALIVISKLSRETRTRRINTWKSARGSNEMSNIILEKLKCL